MVRTLPGLGLILLGALLVSIALWPTPAAQVRAQSLTGTPVPTAVSPQLTPTAAPPTVTPTPVVPPPTAASATTAPSTTTATGTLPAPTAGGAITFASPDGVIVVTAPPGAFEGPVTFAYSARPPGSIAPPAGGRVVRAFTLEAMGSNGALVQPKLPVRLDVRYDPSGVGPNEVALIFRVTDAGQESLLSRDDRSAGVVSTTLTRFSLYSAAVVPGAVAITGGSEPPAVRPPEAPIAPPEAPAAPPAAPPVAPIAPPAAPPIAPPAAPPAPVAPAPAAPAPAAPVAPATTGGTGLTTISAGAPAAPGAPPRALPRTGDFPLAGVGLLAIGLGVLGLVFRRGR